MCGARQIQILPYADDFSLSPKVNISKVVMQFTSQMTRKLQCKICPARVGIFGYLDKNPPSLRNADTFKVLSVQLLARGTEKLYSLELSPKGALRDYDYCLLFSSKSPVLPIMLIIFLLLVSLEKEQAKL